MGACCRFCKKQIAVTRCYGSHIENAIARIFECGLCKHQWVIIEVWDVLEGGKNSGEEEQTSEEQTDN